MLEVWVRILLLIAFGLKISYTAFDQVLKLYGEKISSVCFLKSKRSNPQNKMNGLGYLEDF